MLTLRPSYFGPQQIKPAEKVKLRWDRPDVCTSTPSACYEASTGEITVLLFTGAVRQSASL